MLRRRGADRGSNRRGRQSFPQASKAPHFPREQRRQVEHDFDFFLFKTRNSFAGLKILGP